jgi:hypothetical protein
MPFDFAAVAMVLYQSTLRRAENEIVRANLRRDALAGIALLPA